MGAWAAEHTGRPVVKAGVDARRSAAQVVGRVLRSGAYSNRLVDASALGGPDGALFRFLTYTTLRHLRFVDSVIEEYSSKTIAGLDSEVLDVLRVAVTEMLYGRAPSHAIVDSAVESVKRGKSKRAAGFVNGLLRSILRSGPPDPPEDPRVEYPAWLPANLEADWDFDEVQAFLTASLGDAPRQVRARPGAETDGRPPIPGIPGAFEWTDAGDLGSGFVIQDAASVAVGNSVPLRSGDLVLDLAAAPGGKAVHLRDRGATVVASDRHLRRVKDGRNRYSMLMWVAADARQLPFGVASFDHVLLDAPCSGLGTMRRRPEIRYRMDQPGVDHMRELQGEMLEAALKLVKPGGTVTYSVCTVTPQETVAVVAGHDAEPPPGVPGRHWGNGVLLGPHLTGTDGMFISVVTRR